MENNMYRNVIRFIICRVKLKEHSYVTETSSKTKIHKDTFTCLWLEKYTLTSIWESIVSGTLMLMNSWRITQLSLPKTVIYDTFFCHLFTGKLVYKCSISV